MEKTKTRKSLPAWFHYTLMCIPGYIWLFLFSIVPMVGIVMAFQNYNPSKGWFGSDWVGLQHFEFLWAIPDAKRALWNTLVIAVSKVILNIVVPMAFALMLNEVKNMKFKKGVQTIVYLPHFISWSVVGGLVYMLLSLNTGTINNVIVAMGGTAQNFTGMNAYFRGIVVVSGIWKNMGWSAIVYLAAITGVDEELYEAAYIDGANRFNRLWHITLPGIRTTISVMLILQVGNLLSVNFDQIYILINDMVLETGETLDYYIYRVGLYSTNNFSQATAVGLIKSLIGFVLVITTNIITKRMTDGEGGIW